jgi:hypothetical protein
MTTAKIIGDPRLRSWAPTETEVNLITNLNATRKHWSVASKAIKSHGLYVNSRAIHIKFILAQHREFMKYMRSTDPLYKRVKKQYLTARNSIIDTTMGLVYQLTIFRAANPDAIAQKESPSEQMLSNFIQTLLAFEYGERYWTDLIIGIITAPDANHEVWIKIIDDIQKLMSDEKLLLSVAPSEFFKVQKLGTCTPIHHTSPAALRTHPPVYNYEDYTDDVVAASPSQAPNAPPSHWIPYPTQPTNGFQFSRYQPSSSRIPAPVLPSISR